MAPVRSPVWQTSRFAIDLSHVRVMAIVNVTPDSFSDGGSHADMRAALEYAQRAVEQGAHILDVGGESTRPGAPVVPLATELERVLPVVRELVGWGVPVSVDTYKPEVMQACLEAGADIINDVWALRRASATGGPSAEAVVSQHGACGVCLMHMHLEPQTMQHTPMEGDVLAQVADFLQARTQALGALGVAAGRVVWDVGTGFGKTLEQNFSLLARQEQLLAWGYPLLTGWSRKSSLGRVTGQADAKQRVVSSVAAALLAAERGSRIVRVHDVPETLEALQVWQALQQYGR